MRDQEFLDIIKQENDIQLLQFIQKKQEMEKQKKEIMKANQDKQNIYQLISQIQQQLNEMKQQISDKNQQQKQLIQNLTNEIFKQQDQREMKYEFKIQKRQFYYLNLQKKYKTIQFNEYNYNNTLQHLEQSQQQIQQTIDDAQMIIFNKISNKYQKIFQQKCNIKQVDLDFINICQKYEQSKESINSILLQQFIKYTQIDENEQIQFNQQYGIEQQTFAMCLAKKGIIPDQKYQHDSSTKNFNGQTVAMMLAQQKLKHIPEFWRHDPSLQNDQGFTVAMIYAQNSIIPSEEWQHRTDIKNKYGNTVAMILAKNKIIPQNQWFHNVQLQNNEECSVAMILVQNSIIPTKKWSYGRSDYYDLSSWSLGEELCKQHFVPTRYVIDISYSSNQTIDYFRNNKIPIPSQYQETNPTIFDQAMLQQIPDIEGRQSDEQNEDGFTVAMILVLQNIEVPQQWQHKPEIQNNYGQTAFDIYIQKHKLPPQWTYRDTNLKYINDDTQALRLARNNIEIPEQLYHDPTIKDKYGYTVSDYQILHGVQVQEHFRLQNSQLTSQEQYYIDQYCQYYKIKINYNINPEFNINSNKMTIAMYLASQGIIPPKVFVHNKLLRCKYNGQYYYTVQNIFQYLNIDVPEEWNYDILNNDEDNQAMIDADNGSIPSLGDNDPSYQNKYGYTVAITLASQGIIPPKEWQHNPKICNTNNYTVEEYLQNKDKQVPIYWQRNN